MPERTVTLSDGSVWRYDANYGGQWRWFNVSEDRGMFRMPVTLVEPTAADLRAIADVLDPALPPLRTERKRNEPLREGHQAPA